MSQKYPPARERFEARIDRSGDCWLWTGHTRPNGYGCFRVGRKQTSVHRFAYEEFVGPIPEGMHVDHLCRVRSCANPLHLELVSPRENVLRGEAPTVQLFRDDVCKQGHALVGDNVYVWDKRPTQRICKTCRNQRSVEYQRQRRARARAA